MASFYHRPEEPDHGPVDCERRSELGQALQSLCFAATEEVGHHHAVVKLEERSEGWWKAAHEENGEPAVEEIWVDELCSLPPSPSAPAHNTTSAPASALTTMTRTSVVDIEGGPECILHPDLQSVLGLIVGLVHRSINPNITTLRFDLAAPLSATVQDVHTLVLWVWYFGHASAFPSIRTENVAKVVINIPYSHGEYTFRHRLLPARDREDLHPPEVDVGCHGYNGIPELVGIYRQTHWRNSALGWFDHFFSQLLRNSHIRLVLVDIFQISPRYIGLDSYPTSQHERECAFIEWACREVDELADGWFHADWTMAQAKEAIRGITFYTSAQYIELIGEAQFDIETVKSCPHNWTPAAEATLRNIKYNLETNCEDGYGLLDYNAFPHIVELVLKYADLSTCLAFRQTCKSLLEATDDEHFWKNSITVEIGTYWDVVADQQHPETGFVDVFASYTQYSSSRNPALYALRSHDDEGYDTAGLGAISKAKVIDLQARCDMSLRECSDLSQDYIDMVTKALTSLRRSRDRDIPILRVEEALPTPVIDGGVHTMINFEWAYRNSPVRAPLNVPSVARVVLHVAFDKYYFNLGFERFESPPAAVLKRRPTARCVNSAVPHLVVIFSDFPSLPSGFWHNHWDNLKLGWLNHLFETIIYDCHRSVTIVGTLTLHPVLLGFSDTFSSSEHYVDAIVKAASSMAEEWCDGSLERHPGWTQALGKAAISNITFLTHEEYRQLIGGKQYTMETVLPWKE